MVIVERTVYEEEYKHLFLSIKLIKAYDEKIDDWKTYAYIVNIHKHVPEQGYVGEKIASIAYPANEYKNFRHNFIPILEKILQTFGLAPNVYRIGNNIYIAYQRIPKKLVWLESWYKNSLLTERFAKFVARVDDIIDVMLMEQEKHIVYGYFTPFILADNDIYKQLGVAASVLP